MGRASQVGDTLLALPSGRGMAPPPPQLTRNLRDRGGSESSLLVDGPAGPIRVVLSGRPRRGRPPPVGGGESLGRLWRPGSASPSGGGGSGVRHERDKPRRRQLKANSGSWRCILRHDRGLSRSSTSM